MIDDQDVVELLLEQHSEIKSLFARVAEADKDHRRQSFDDLVRMLAVHEAAEEEVVHPAVRRKVDDGDTIAEARLEEEHEAKTALADLYDLGVDHPEFDGRLRTLATAVIAHATNEETMEFPRLREILEPDELRKMAGAIKAAEAIAPTRPHPMAGESATANLLTGPPLAVFDRARDAVRNWRLDSD